MLKGTLRGKWAFQPFQTASLPSKISVSYQPYRCSPNSIPPVKSEAKAIQPTFSVGAEASGLSDKEKLRLDMLSLKKVQNVTWKDFSDLTKFKLSALNTWVAATGYFMTNKCLYADMGQVGLFLIAVQMSAMSSQAMNQAIEVEHDKKMKRTAHRPLPLGKFTPAQATSISWGLLGASNILLYSLFGWQAGAVANAIFSSYIWIYTPMKRTSEANTIWGSLVGAIVPYLGWFAGGGSALSMSPFFLCSFIFAWQFPHFYGILWTYKDDYKRGGFKMLEDPIKAARHSKLAVAGYLASTIGLICTGDISIYSSIPAGYAYWKYGWKPAVEFEKNPSLENAKKMKYNSYWPFTVFMLSVILGILQRVYLHEYHQEVLPEEVKKETTQVKAEEVQVDIKSA